MPSLPAFQRMTPLSSKPTRSFATLPSKSKSEHAGRSERQHQGQIGPGVAGRCEPSSMSRSTAIASRSGSKSARAASDRATDQLGVISGSWGDALVRLNEEGHPGLSRSSATSAHYVSVHRIATYQIPSRRPPYPFPSHHPRLHLGGCAVEVSRWNGRYRNASMYIPDVCPLGRVSFF